MAISKHYENSSRSKCFGIPPVLFKHTFLDPSVFLIYFLSLLIAGKIKQNTQMEFSLALIIKDFF